MKATLDKKELEAVFRVGVNEQEWEVEVNNAYNRTKGKYKIPGFRPGKAPRRMIENYYGPNTFADAAVDGCINTAYYEQIAAHPELDVFGQPEVQFVKPEDGERIAFSIKVTLAPVAKLGEYKGIKLPKIEYNVTDEDVETRIASDLKKAARLVEIDGPAKDGDTLTIDFVGTVDGVEFDGGKAEGHELKLGSHTFIPGFEEQLVGANKGDERDVNVTFPDDYHAENLKGKAAVFRVTVHKVVEEQLPALDDKFVSEHTKYATADEYKAGLRADIQAMYDRRTRNERIDTALKAIVDNAECKIADKVIDAEVERLYRDMEQQLKAAYGIPFEEYLKYSNSSPEKYREENRPRAEENIKVRTVMTAIIEAEKISVTEEEAHAKLESDAQLRKNYETAAKARGLDAEEYAANDVLADKLFAFVLANNEFVLDPKEVAEAGKKSEKTKKTEKTEKSDKPATKKVTAKKSENAADGEKTKKSTAKTADGDKPAAKKTTAKKPAKTNE